MRAFVCCVLVSFAVPAFAQNIVDGDTIKMYGTTYRLWGIDAPKTKQQCADGWPAGIEATKAISELMRGKTINCEARGRDRYGRTIGLCRADGRDLGADMVRAGIAGLHYGGIRRRWASPKTTM